MDEENGRRSGETNAPAPSGLFGDEDAAAALALSQLGTKQQGGAEPGPDVEHNVGNGDSPPNSFRTLGDELPEISSVIREGAEARSEVPKVATFVLRRENGKWGMSGGTSRAMPSPQPTGSTVVNSSEKNSSKLNSVGSLGNDLPETPPVTGERAEARVGGFEEPEVPTFVQSRATDESVEDGGLSRAMPCSPPPGFTVRRPRTGSRKNFSKVDDGGNRTTEKEGSTGSKEDAPSEVRTPSLKTRKIVGSAQTGADEQRKEHTGSALGETGSCVLALGIPSEQEKKKWVARQAKVCTRTNGIGEQGSTVLRSISEQEKTNGQVYKRKVLLGTNGIGNQGDKLSSCQSREVSDGGRAETSDKAVSAASQPNNEPSLHSGQTSVEGRLPSAVTRHWNSDADVFTSCRENKEICMQAACALYRQGRLTTVQPTQRGRSASTLLGKGVADRVVKAVKFLSAGSLQGLLKRTFEELVKHDADGASLLEKVVLERSKLLFDIYRNKEDPCFC